MSDLNLILTSLQRLLIDHLATSEPLTVGMAIGDKAVRVPNSSRFKAGDEALIVSDTALAPNGKVGVVEKVVIEEVLSYDDVRLVSGVTRAWPLGENPYLLKAIDHLPVKRITVGDLRRIPDFPFVTIAPASESNEWVTLRATSHEFRATIRAYVLTDNFERAEILIVKLAEAIREILIDHIHPFVDGTTYSLTSSPSQNPLPRGSTVVAIPNTSSFEARRIVYIRDAGQIRRILLTAARVAGLVTLTTEFAHGLLPGQQVVVSRVDDISFNGVFTILTTPTATTLTFAQALANAVGTGGRVSEPERIPSQEVTVRSVLSPTMLELAVPTEADYFANRQGELMAVNRYLYDTRPERISYGYVPGTGGSLMRAVEIDYFAKMEIIRRGNILT